MPAQKQPLETEEVVDTLDRLDLLELAGDSPWPEVNDGYDVYPIDWRAVESETPTDETAVDTADDEGGGSWQRVESELRSRLRAGGGTPPPVDILDVQAWYQPIHYFGLAWGIYIREEAVLHLAAYLLQAAPEKRRFDVDVMLGAIRMGLGVIYLHEAFHHRMEWFATGLEIVEHEKRYCPYHDRVFKPLRAQGSDDLLEEALATAQGYRNLNYAPYKRGVPRDLFEPARQSLKRWIELLPPGYRKANDFRSDGPFEAALHRLCSQIHEASPQPGREGSEWRVAAQMHRTHFTCTTTTWIVVPIGEKPIVPWFGSEWVSALSIPTRDVIKVLRTKYGYELVSGGKHQKLVKPGVPTLPLPSNREALSYPVLRSVARVTGFSSVQDMARALF